MFTRTVSAAVPSPGKGRAIIATALLEAPDVDGAPGEWKAIEAKGAVLDRVQSRHAELEDAWYCLQWHDDAQVSVFSEPVRLSGQVASNTGRPRR